MCRPTSAIARLAIAALIAALCSSPVDAIDADYFDSLPENMQHILDSEDQVKLVEEESCQWKIKHQGGCKEVLGPNQQWEGGAGDDLYMQVVNKPWAGEAKYTVEQCQQKCEATAGCKAALFGNPEKMGTEGMPHIMFQGCCQLYRGGCTSDGDPVNMITWEHWECEAPSAPSYPTCDCSACHWGFGNYNHPIFHTYVNKGTHCEVMWGTDRPDCPAERANPFTGTGDAYVQDCATASTGENGCCNRQCCDGTGPQPPQ